MIRAAQSAVVILGLAAFLLSQTQFNSASSEQESREPARLSVDADASELAAKPRPSIRESGVEPVVYLQSFGGGTSSFRIRELTIGRLHWDFRNEPQNKVVVPPQAEDVAIKIVGAGATQLITQKGVTTDVLKDTGENWELTGVLASDAHGVVLARGGDATVAGSISIVVARPHGSKSFPFVNGYSNAFHSKGTTAFDSQSASSTPRIEVRKRFLRLKVEPYSPSMMELAFHIFTENAGKLEFRGVVKPHVRSDAIGAWITDLALPGSIGLPSIGAVIPITLNREDGSYGGSQPDQSPRFKTSTDINDLSRPAKIKPVGASAANSVVRLQTRKQEFQAEKTDPRGVIVFRVNGGTPVAATSHTTDDGKTVWKAVLEFPKDGNYEVTGHTAIGPESLFGAPSDVVTVQVRTAGFEVINVTPSNLSLADDKKVEVQFSRDIDATKFGTTGDPEKNAFALKNNSSDGAGVELASVEVSSSDPKTAILTYATKFGPGVYELTVKPNSNLVDVFGNQLARETKIQLVKPIEDFDQPTISRGIRGKTGSYVEFPEYTMPRPSTQGFNPSDRVETRVVRLYYFRDAHRLAQIVNRNVRSYNGAAVDRQQRLADRARGLADQATDDRQTKERKAASDAQSARAAEGELQRIEQLLQTSAAEEASVRQEIVGLESRDPASLSQEETARLRQLRAVAPSLGAMASRMRQDADAQRRRVQAAREEESRSHERWQQAIAVEDRAREEQFRREVAAGTEDPDTYAPGNPESIDPVRRVSVSVIGEGMLQLRGPMKGINIIRLMINQIDSPVGQVRLGVHTVQINGEHGDRMDVVAERIQRFIDHSRFLTLQSAEMLRKSIVMVASQKAAMISMEPGLSQRQRDEKYLYAFFGADFIRELEAMDSEFLHTGNKLLSLHSMNSTSLASALFIMALAKNSTRIEILNTFEGMMRSQLPFAEQNYFDSGLTCDGKKKLFEHCHPEEFQLLSHNARFQSIRGFFDAEIAADNTMTPIQREFLRLAQIFKQRLITELELNQRVMERSIIEERLGDYQEHLKLARQKEQLSQDALRRAREKFRNAQRTVIAESNQVSAAAVRWNADYSALASALDAASKVDLNRLKKFIAQLEKGNPRELVASLKAYDQLRAIEITDQDLETAKIAKSWGGADDPLDQRFNAYDAINDLFLEKGAKPEEFTEVWNNVRLADSVRLEPIPLSGQSFRVGARLGEDGKPVFELKDAKPMLKIVLAIIKDAEDFVGFLQLPGDMKSEYDDAIKNTAALVSRFDDWEPVESPKVGDLITVTELVESAQKICIVYNSLFATITSTAHKFTTQLDAVAAQASREVHQIDAQKLQRDWLLVHKRISSSFRDGTDVKNEYLTVAKGTEVALNELLEVGLDLRFALKDAEDARRPLDHKKFLDMLVDQMEEKYIELLEGTRAHTSNIDAYIKRLMTALDDDFNTQFYYPSFRKVRGASRAWDVTLGQVETTTILANNRAFAKVSPQATMEFDLPKRDIVIAEAMNSAKAMIDDYGALVQDPSFLGLASLNSGQGTSSPAAGAAGGLSTVRNVLPGLSTSSAEQVMAQQGPGGTRFGAALEGLIPDPAIYKFETGTGFEVRPVIQPDGQSLVFNFNYMYTTNVREPVRADEKHLGRVKRHFLHTDVQLSNFELREVSRYTVALKASRTARGVPLLEDIPGVGALFRPAPSSESSLQQNVILSQATIFPTLFDLMGLRWAPVVADMDPLRLSNSEFIVRNRRRALMNRVFDHSSNEVDRFLRIPEGERRMDLYRSQETIPRRHPNGYSGPGANLRQGVLREGPPPTPAPSQPIPAQDPDGLRSPRPLSNPFEAGEPQTPIIPHDNIMGFRHDPRVAPASFQPPIQARRLAARAHAVGQANRHQGQPPNTTAGKWAYLPPRTDPRAQYRQRSHVRSVNDRQAAPPRYRQPQPNYRR